MRLVGELKNKVEKTENINEAKELIKDAGMELTDDEMENVSGGNALQCLKQRGVIYKWDVKDIGEN